MIFHRFSCGFRTVSCASSLVVGSTFAQRVADVRPRLTVTDKQDVRLWLYDLKYGKLVAAYVRHVRHGTPNENLPSVTHERTLESSPVPHNELPVLVETFQVKRRRLPIKHVAVEVAAQINETLRVRDRPPLPKRILPAAFSSSRSSKSKPCGSWCSCVACVVSTWQNARIRRRRTSARVRQREEIRDRSAEGQKNTLPLPLAAQKEPCADPKRC